MASNHFSAHNSTARVGRGTNDNWESQPFSDFAHTDPMMRTPGVQHGFDSISHTSGTMPAQRCPVSPLLNVGFPGSPAVHENPDWLPDAALQGPNFGHANTHESHQSIDSSQVFTFEVLGDRPVIGNLNHLSGNKSQGSHNTFHGNPFRESNTGRYVCAVFNPSLRGLALSLLTPGSHRPVSPQALRCEWRGCTYTGTFATLPLLRRHVETLHLNPGSFLCPVPTCQQTFNRNDNLQVHLRHMAQRDRDHWLHGIRQR
jgi:hypothetical protein